MRNLLQSKVPCTDCTWIILFCFLVCFQNRTKHTRSCKQNNVDYCLVDEDDRPVDTDDESMSSYVPSEEDDDDDDYDEDEDEDVRGLVFVSQDSRFW